MEKPIFSNPILSANIGCIVAAVKAGRYDHYAHFRCDRCGDKVFTGPVKPSTDSNLTFCSDSCLDGFFIALNAGELEGAAR